MKLNDFNFYLHYHVTDVSITSLKNPDYSITYLNGKDLFNLHVNPNTGTNGWEKCATLDETRKKQQLLCCLFSSIGRIT